MLNLVGEYEVRVDAKGRLTLPTALKKQLDSVFKQEFVLKKSLYNICLEFYPISEWNEQMKKFGNLNMFLKDTRDFMRRFQTGYKTVELDNVGRLLIPRDLISYSGIKNDVVVVSMGNFIEIWNKSNHQKFEKDKSIDMAVLAEKVTMGKSNE